MVYVVDAPCGVGKTSGAINEIKKNKDKKYIFITPYLNEVERVCNECGLRQPVKYNGAAPKIIDLKNMLNHGKSIVTTHAMFHNFDEEVIDLCYGQGYTLIMDEVYEVVQTYPISKADLDLLMKEFCFTTDDGVLHWNKDKCDYDGFKFKREKILCELGCLTTYKDMVMLWMFPVEIFKAFRDSYILTYMFDAQIQCYYYNFYGIEYQKLFVHGDNIRNYRFSEEPIDYLTKYNYCDLIHICQDSKLNMVGDYPTALSKAWYLANGNKQNANMKRLKNNTINFFKNKMNNSPSDKNLWTTFLDYKDLVKSSPYTKGFLSCNARGTNNYRNRTAVAYLVNRYLNPVIKNFFTMNDIVVDEDQYALSEMIQFIWRSAIRDGKEIWVYIPSKRMRRLMEDWIVNNTNIN